jgi:hypothetical protein
VQVFHLQILGDQIDVLVLKLELGLAVLNFGFATRIRVWVSYFEVSRDEETSSILPHAENFGAGP